ncbi:GIY-YIG nuclease family protein [Mucilaginibacter mali]|uniref:GIY-YIG nuclease family protein n=1 Tax=Mucilaginibacter mali TaxID=2740462 RepID=A0A7D4TZI3_9SPHI|nr:GIY-YIG nuclease family protein [Mucilaginibacter mali]QKJ32257.1 GIY-YIG nuclease family protein [Mucilaginibacter mali]
MATFGGYVYIITNKYNAVLYTGVTSELYNRICKHKNKEYPTAFSAKYNCDKLVYYSGFPTINEAIAEEKRIKGCSRNYKIDLIESKNPKWIDLFDNIPDEA